MHILGEWDDYPWEEISKYNLKEFKEWWDEDDFSWYDSGSLCDNCYLYFPIWWNSKYFDWDYGTGSLCESCNFFFKLWYNSKTFPFYDWGESLIEHCQDYKDMWEKDYLVWKLKQS